ncbi:hypothetical protein [Mesorhizobium kowhaii]|nr:hypothetical protein [Mesorhizobium kowhaii]
MAKKVLPDCGSSVEPDVTVEITAITRRERKADDFQRSAAARK